jgi:pimeloyl-ACP methyl ester carboxylesterase
VGHRRERSGGGAQLALSFASGPDHISGELVLPRGAGRHPAVVMLRGAGGDSREGYRPVADAFAAAGVAAFIFDNPGAGRSSGRAEVLLPALACAALGVVCCAALILGLGWGRARPIGPAACAAIGSGAWLALALYWLV